MNVSVARKSCLFPVSFILSPESPLVPAELEFSWKRLTTPTQVRDKCIVSLSKGCADHPLLRSDSGLIHFLLSSPLFPPMQEAGQSHWDPCLRGTITLPTWGYISWNMVPICCRTMAWMLTGLVQFFKNLQYHCSERWCQRAWCGMVFIHGPVYPVGPISPGICVFGSR